MPPGALLRRAKTSVSVLFYLPLALGLLLLLAILSARFLFGIGLDEMRDFYERWRMRVEGRYKVLPPEGAGRSEGPGGEELHALGEDDEGEELGGPAGADEDSDIEAGVDRDLRGSRIGAGVG